MFSFFKKKSRPAGNDSQTLRETASTGEAAPETADAAARASIGEEPDDFTSGFGRYFESRSSTFQYPPLVGSPGSSAEDKSL